MASINWQKQTRQKAGAMKRHLGRREREEVNHSNPDIDKSKSHLNYYIGCNDYDEAYQRMCDRVKAVDKKYPPKRIKKDRIVCASLEIPCPLVITEQGRSREFFEAAYREIEKFFGAENVGGACVHLDEVHNYIDAKDGQEKTSLEHETILVAAYAEWKEKDKATGNEIERKGINGKHFETKARLKALNKAMCEMVRETFGVEYNTGEGARKKTAEILKAETELATAKIAKEKAETELAEINAEKQKEESRLAELKQQNEEYVRSLEPTPTKKIKGIFGEKEQPKTEEELQRDREVLAAQAVLKENEERTRELDKRESNISSKEQSLSRRAEAISSEEKNIFQQKKDLSEWQKSLSDRERKIKTGELLQARYIAEKILKKFGVKFNRFDVQRELERQVYSKENLQPQNQKGR